jgi:hypothetical protein
MKPFQAPVLLAVTFILDITRGDKGKTLALGWNIRN